MATAIVHTFKEINVGKYATVKHFKLEKVTNGKTQIGDKINLAKDRNFAKSMPEYWLKTHNGIKWSKYALTGLFKTKRPNYYKGDASRKKHLILAYLNERNNNLIIYFYKDYYTADYESILNSL